MSNFDFIRLPKELIQENYEKIKYRGQTVRPERLDKFVVDYEEWIKRFELPDDKKSKEIWRMSISSKNIQVSFISPLIKSKYNAELSFVCGGMDKGGCTYVAYIDDKFKYIYFYTMNRWKRIYEKYYRVIIYRVPYELYDMLSCQNIYETFLQQNSSGFKFKIMTHKQFLENRIKYWKMDITKNKEIKWN